LKTTEERSIIHNTFFIERNFRATQERVFSAFADPAKKRRWFAEGHHHEIERYEMDFRVGGTESSLYRFKEGTPFPGATLANDGNFLEIVRDQRIVAASRMTMGDKVISISLVTFEFLPADEGTNLILTHQGVFYEGSGGTKMREEGWRTLIEHLAAELSH
jgi:uncharacterized protein YndB with AHSA1/START domain